MRGDTRQLMVGLVQDEAEFCVEALRLQIDGDARWAKCQNFRQLSYIFACLALMI